MWVQEGSLAPLDSLMRVPQVQRTRRLFTTGQPPEVWRLRWVKLCQRSSRDSIFGNEPSWQKVKRGEAVSRGSRHDGRPMLRTT